MAFFRTPSLEVVFLHRQLCDRVGSCCSGDQRILFFVFGIIWLREHTIGLWRQVKPVFDHRDAHRDLCFVGHEGGIPGDLPARFAVPRSPIRDVVSICAHYSVLPILFTERLVPKNPSLALVVPGRIISGRCGFISVVRQMEELPSKSSVYSLLNTKNMPDCVYPCPEGYIAGKIQFSPFLGFF